MLGFYVPLTAKVIRRRDLGLKSHPKDCHSTVDSGVSFKQFVFVEVIVESEEERKRSQMCYTLLVLDCSE